MPSLEASYPERAAALQRRLAAEVVAGADKAPFGLAKSTSNLFRDRAAAPRRQLDLGGFDHVIAIDAERQQLDVEGLTTYEQLVAASLPQGLMPAVVPQLKTITVGGALAGVGIEATSFRHGLVHESMLEFDVLLPDGRILRCAPDNPQRDLFFGFPNSYGTLGYALRIRLRTLPVRPFVRVRHLRHASAEAFFGALAEACGGPHDFVDGVVFDGGRFVLSLAEFVDAAVAPSDYGFERIYYRSLLEREVDELRTADYLWRWDTDWFWCSKNVFAQHPLVRRLYGRERLNSRTYTRIMRWNQRVGLTRLLAKWRGRHPEAVIQDVDIPIGHAAEFLAFLLREIGILPVWICPFRAVEAGRRFPLYPLTPGTLYVNFGFWDTVDSRVPHAPGHFNRLVEREAERLGGIKSLYSDSFYSREEFARAYDMDSYAQLKAKYDPERRLPDLYDKCVQHA